MAELLLYRKKALMSAYRCTRLASPTRNCGLRMYCFLAFILMWALWSLEYPLLHPVQKVFAIFAASLLCVLSAVPVHRWRAAIVVWEGLIVALIVVNYLKGELVDFPLTEQDIVIALNDPGGLADAIGISRTAQSTLLVGVPALIVVWLVLTRKNYLYLPRLNVITAVLRQAIVTIVPLIGFCWFYADFGEHIRQNKDIVFGPDEWWNNDRYLTGSRSLGALGFLAFTHAEGKSVSALLNVHGTKAGDRPIFTDELSRVFEKFHPDGASISVLRPNIVFVLAESTFDPSAVFELDKRVDSALFETTLGRTNGLLHVTPVGGGTWRTEFETITGIDSRLFGFLGEYTHRSLAPVIKDSFVMHLERLGYSTGAYYPVEGNFYNARFAYGHYGFDSFEDANDLGLEKDWGKFTDDGMARQVVDRLNGNTEAPFFRYLVLLENHAPHLCRDSGNVTSGPRFLNNNEGDKSCVLTEYLRRVRSTERGFERIIGRLSEIERNTGRPFIAVIFGDHQPHTFVTERFDSNRTALGSRYTFYSIATSNGFEPKHNFSSFHATLLPTLVSALIARNKDEVYMPENFYVYEACGDLARPSECQLIPELARAYKRYLLF